MKKTSDLLKLSASSIKTYKQCHRKYYFQYIEKLPKKEWAHLDLGNFVHKVLEIFHERVQKENIPTEKLSETLTWACKEAIGKFKLDSDNRAKAKQMLRDYLDVIRNTGLPEVLFNEKSFNIYLTENLLVRGFIDRIDRDENRGFHIIDYKTGKSKYLDDFQLLIYGLHLLQENPNMQHVKASYIVLPENCKFLSFTFSRTDLDRVKNDIIKVADEIRNDQTWEPNPQFLCSYCDFENICPATKKDGGLSKTGWIKHSK